MENQLIRIEKSLFDAALDLEEPDLRQAFLEQTCRGNPSLRARLEALLDAYSDSDRVFDIDVLQAVGGPVVEDVDLQIPPLNELSQEAETEYDFAEASNTWIGRYKLVRRLGYGGCGVVYAAEQQEPVQRQVALKIIRLGMNTDCVRRYGNNSRVCAARNGGVNVADCGASNLAASRMWRG